MELENKLQQVRTISDAISNGEEITVDFDPELVARKEEKDELSYTDQIMRLLNDV